MDDRPWSSLSGRNSSNSSLSSRPGSVQPRNSAGRGSFGGALSSQTRKILQQLEKMSTPVRDAKRMCMGERWDPEKSAPPLGTGQEKLSSGRLRGPPLNTFHAPALPSPASSRISSLSSRNSEPYWNWRRVVGDEGNEEGSVLSTPVASVRRGTALNGGGKIKSARGKATPVASVFNTDQLNLEYSHDLNSYNPALTIDSGRVPAAGFLSGPANDRTTMENSTEVSLQPSQNFAFANPVPLASSRFSFSQPASLTGPRTSNAPNPPILMSKPLANGPSLKRVVPKIEPPEMEEEVEKEEEEDEAESSVSTSSSDEEEMIEAPATDSSIGFDSFRGGQKWQCSSCHFRNPVGETSCVNCLSKNSKSSRQKESGPKETEASKWTCKKCTLPNSADTTQCLCCKASKDWKPPQKATTSSGEKWTCDTCMISNAATLEQCVACKAPKPGAAKAKPTNAAPFGASSSGGAKWTCDTCFVSNDAAKSQCSACSTPKPGSQKPPKDPFATAAKSAGSKWTCEACFVGNDANKDACIACATPKPGSGKVQKPFEKTTFTSSSTNSTHSFGLGTTTKDEKKPWNCTTCFVQNKSSNANCQACSSMKPGNTIPPVSFGLPFGKRAAEDNVDNGPGSEKKVRFTANTTDSNGKVAPMTFGIPSATVKSDAAAPGFGGNLVFGLKNDTREEEKSDSEPSAKRKLDSNTTSSTPLFGTSGASGANPISFSAPKPKESADKPAAPILFGATPAPSATATANAPAKILFGASAAKSSTEGTTGPAKTLFGAQPGAEKPSTTNLFGATSAGDGAKGMFSFGKKDDTAKTTGLGTPTAMTPDTPVVGAKSMAANPLTFGAPKTTAATTGAAPIFTSTPAAAKSNSQPSGGFSLFATGTAAPAPGLKLDSGFKFGESKPTNPAAAAAPALPTFGAPAAAKPGGDTPSFLTAPKAAPVPATFSFGKPPEQNTAGSGGTGLAFGNKDISLSVPGAFQFSAAPAPSAAPSNPGIIQFNSTTPSGGGAGATRPLLKAKRKIRK